MVGYYPVNLLEALKDVKEHEDMIIVSGGTDVMVSGKRSEHMMFLNGVEELKNICEEDGLLRIGAECTYSEMINDSRIPEILKTVMKQIASPAVRSSGTLSGNICNASPAGDSLPVLYALSAIVVSKYLNDSGEVVTEKFPIEKFILGIRKIALKKEALVTEIEIPIESYSNVSKMYYEKVGARKSEAISKLSFVGLIKTDKEKIIDARIAFGSVSIKVVRKSEIEKKIIGLTLDQLDNKKEEFIEEYSEFITPIDDQRSTNVVNLRKIYKI